MAVHLAFLKRLRDDHVSQRSLIELLDKRLAGKRERRSHKRVHVSTVTDDDLGFCPRQYALLDVLEQKLPPEYVSSATRVAFDTGDSLHDLCRNHWLREDVIGGWHCVKCGEERHFTKLPLGLVKTPGSEPHAHEWEYFEETFTDTKDSGLTCSIDFFVDLGNKKLTTVEAKTIDKDEFAALVAPLARHRLRSQMYLAMIDRSASEVVKDQIDLTHARILYISKGFGKKHLDHGKILPFKEFAVPRNDEVIEKFFELGRQVHRFRKGGPMPPVICANQMDRRAKTCVVCKACFSGKYPAGIKWV